jgi:hypothetical protein
LNGENQTGAEQCMNGLMKIKAEQNRTEWRGQKFQSHPCLRRIAVWPFGGQSNKTLDYLKDPKQTIP